MSDNCPWLRDKDEDLVSEDEDKDEERESADEGQG